jgi:hypothetical protein
VLRATGLGLLLDLFGQVKTAVPSPEGRIIIIIIIGVKGLIAAHTIPVGQIIAQPTSNFNKGSQFFVAITVA